MVIPVTWFVEDAVIDWVMDFHLDSSHRLLIHRSTGSDGQTFYKIYIMKDVIYNYNGKLARFYRWYYGKGVMPNKSCTYYFRLMCSFLFVIPGLLLALPWIIFEMLHSITNKKKYHFIDQLNDAAGVGMVIWFFMLVVYLYTKNGYYTYQYVFLGMHDKKILPFILINLFFLLLSLKSIFRYLKPKVQRRCKDMFKCKNIQWKE